MGREDLTCPSNWDVLVYPRVYKDTETCLRKVRQSVAFPDLPEDG